MGCFFFIREILKVPSDTAHSMILLNQINLSFIFTYSNENSSEANKGVNTQTTQPLFD